MTTQNSAVIERLKAERRRLFTLYLAQERLFFKAADAAERRKRSRKMNRLTRLIEPVDERIAGEQARQQEAAQ